MIVEGILKEIFKTEDVGTSGFQKRDCVVTTDEQYPQHILIQFVQDKCNNLTSFKVGEKVKVDINLRGREWVNPQGETKYFNSIQGWRISSVGEPHTATLPPVSPPVFVPAQNLKEDEPDDLPF
jgi:hypothetical protein